MEDSTPTQAARSTEKLDASIQGFHARLADSAALLKMELDRLWKQLDGTRDAKQFDKLTGLIREAHTALGHIHKIEAEVALKQLDDKDALNLEDARAEILRRLDRIAAACDEGSVSG